MGDTASALKEYDLAAQLAPNRADIDTRMACYC